MISFMLLELLPSTKTSWTYIDPITLLAHGVSALESNRMRQVARAIVTLYLQARLADDWYYFIYLFSGEPDRW